MQVRDFAKDFLESFLEDLPGNVDGQKIPTVFSRNSAPRSRTGTRIGGDDCYKPPGAP